MKPEIGIGVTINHYTDQTPGTVVQVSPTRKKIVIQEDKANRTDNNGMSECQSYEYERDPNGTFYVATLRKDGTYRITGSTRTVSIGNRRKYHDYSF
jgi:hypothetical protein